jgi:2-methylcitrate dehydratase PrpD
MSLVAPATNITRTLAEYAASTSVDALPPEVRERGRLILMDELACAAFGQTREPGQLAAEYAASVGGAGPCRIFGTRLRVSAPYAALANGTAGHADEVDGAHVVGGHPGATIVHAVAAVAGWRRTSGAALLNALVLGYEIGNRVVRASGGVFGLKSRLHLHADFLHAVGAAAASCRLLGLALEHYVHAMALATFQANGLCALFGERRHISKSLCNGQFAFAGVSAALMAEAGLEASDDVFGAEHGLVEAWGLENAPQLLIDGLGDTHEVMGANFKFINAGYPIHAAVQAAMVLVTAHDIDSSQIEAVAVGMPTNALRVVDNRAMHNICLQDMLAAALVQRGLRLREDPFPQILTDPAFHDMRSRIALSPDAVLDREQPNGRGARVDLQLRNGEHLSHRVDQPKGHSNGPAVGWDDLIAKWTEGLPNLNVGRLATQCRDVEAMDDVDELFRTFDEA